MPRWSQIQENFLEFLFLALWHLMTCWTNWCFCHTWICIVLQPTTSLVESSCRSTPWSSILFRTAIVERKFGMKSHWSHMCLIRVFILSCVLRPSSNSGRSSWCHSSGRQVNRSQVSMCTRLRSLLLQSASVFFSVLTSGSARCLNSPRRARLLSKWHERTRDLNEPVSLLHFNGQQMPYWSAMKLQSDGIASEACPCLFASLAEVACWSSIFAGSLVNCWGHCKKCFGQGKAWHWPWNLLVWLDFYWPILKAVLPLQAYSLWREWPCWCSNVLWSPRDVGLPGLLGMGRSKFEQCQHSSSVSVRRQFLLWSPAQIQSSMHWSFAVATSSCIAHRMLMCIQGPTGSSWSWWCGRGFLRYFEITFSDWNLNLHCIRPAWLDSTWCADTY